MLAIHHLPFETHSPPYSPHPVPQEVTCMHQCPLSPSGFLLTLTNVELWQDIE